MIRNWALSLPLRVIHCSVLDSGCPSEPTIPGKSCFCSSPELEGPGQSSRLGSSPHSSIGPFDLRFLTWIKILDFIQTWLLVLPTLQHTFLFFPWAQVTLSSHLPVLCRCQDFLNYREAKGRDSWTKEEPRCSGHPESGAPGPRPVSIAWEIICSSLGSSGLSCILLDPTIFQVPFNFHVLMWGFSQSEKNR